MENNLPQQKDKICYTMQVFRLFSSIVSVEHDRFTRQTVNNKGVSQMRSFLRTVADKVEWGINC